MCSMLLVSFCKENQLNYISYFSCMLIDMPSIKLDSFFYCIFSRNNSGKKNEV